jgi:Holliday junction resolvase
LTEAQVQKKIIDYLEENGAYVFKVIKSNRSGVADVIACLNGAFIAFEVKAAKGRPSPLQVKHVEYVRASGGLSEIVYSLEEVKECLLVWNMI